MLACESVAKYKASEWMQLTNIEGDMKKILFRIVSLGLLIASGSVGGASTILFQDGFETSWQGDYAPGWVNAAYRHGEAPQGQMMQQTTVAHSGTYGLKLIANSVPESWMFWAAVEVENLPEYAMRKEYDPWVSAWYYDDNPTADRAGQIYAVPSWVNPYLPKDEDWTDIQFGGRRDIHDYYYYVAAGENSPSWQSTGVKRTEGWHNLKMQLSSVDGKVHFYLDGQEVGASYRNDYKDLGTAIGLYTMFVPPLSGWGEKPFTYWDDFEVGANVPDGGMSAILLGIGFLGLACARRMIK